MSGHEQSQSLKRQDTNDLVDIPLNAPEKDDLRLEIEQALEGIEYGEIKIIVRDSRIVQIERTTRNRPAPNKKFSS
jgi:hypothetical protein